MASTTIPQGNSLTGTAHASPGFPVPFFRPACITPQRRISQSSSRCCPGSVFAQLSSTDASHSCRSFFFFTHDHYFFLSVSSPVARPIASLRCTVATLWRSIQPEGTALNWIRLRRSTLAPFGTKTTNWTASFCRLTHFSPQPELESGRRSSLPSLTEEEY